MCFLIHHLGLLPHGNHFVGATVKSYNGWFVYYYLVIADDDSVGRAKVHRYFLYKRKKSHLFILRIYIVSSKCLFGYFANQDRKSTRLNSSHANISYAVFCLKKKNTCCTLYTFYILY